MMNLCTKIIIRNRPLPAQVYYGVYESRWGSMVVFADAEVLYGCHFLTNSLATHVDLARRRLRGCALLQDDVLIADWAKRLNQGGDVPVVFFGTPFQKSVWRALLQIPFGSTYSYATLARVLGKPKSVRAVANAVGANFFACLVPCHRVLATGGGLGGYRGGVERKKQLLKAERLYSIVYSLCVP